MNISQKQSILTSAQSILEFDFDHFISENNTSGNIDEIKFGDYNVIDFKNTYLKVFKQLKIELESGLNLLLPNQETFNNEFDSVTLDRDSANFYSYLSSFPNKDNAAEILKRFVYYQIRQGFWNKSAVKQHSVDIEKLSDSQNELKIVQKQLTENLELFEKLKKDFEDQINEFQVILESKTTESFELTSLLDNSRNENTEITTLLTSVKAKEAEVTASSSSIKTKLATITGDIETYEERFESLESDCLKLEGNLKQSLEDAKTDIDNAKEGNVFIQTQKEEIIRLIGLAADGSLGYKFNSRKEDLAKGVNNFWRWAVPGSILIALTWVVIIFTTLSAHLGNEWINLVVNLIKTSPAWLLVGFVFSQYGKERNLQEEYAFKSAIAMTLTSYSQMLSEDDNESKSSKQEMLLKSIENLYTQPKLHVEKQEKEKILNTKEFSDSLKSISEMIKSMRS